MLIALVTIGVNCFVHESIMLGKVFVQIFWEETGSFGGKQSFSVLASTNKTLGRALDPRANGTWLSKLTE